MQLTASLDHSKADPLEGLGIEEVIKDTTTPERNQFTIVYLVL